MEDFDERYDLIVNEAKLNVFMFPADKIPGCDLLSDSGTTTMTMEQWSRLLLGDEAYGSNEGYFQLKDRIVETFGPSFKHKDKHFENVFLFHQGRAAERALFYTISELIGASGAVLKPLSDGLDDHLKEVIEQKVHSWHTHWGEPYFIIPSNAHFDTTEANAEHSNLIPINIPCDEAADKSYYYPFKGNMNIKLLESLLENEADRVPIVYLTITNNTGGGQPVSMENIKQVSTLAHRYGIPFFFDACRFAENAWFIRQREAAYKSLTIPEIVREMFDHVDGFHISFKKDGLTNIGGGIIIKEDSLFNDRYPDFRNNLTDFQILTEGHPTYGGMAGRDLKALVEGLKTVIRQEYLDARIKQTKRFGDKLMQYEIPLVTPIGGHAVYLDMDQFFDQGDKDEDFHGISLTALLLIAGHRLCELGLYAFGKYRGNKYFPPLPRVNNVRGAIPRMAYEDQDLFALAEAIKILHDNRDKIPAVFVEYGAELSLSHFKSRFRFVMPE
jgi:tryptophanase